MHRGYDDERDERARRARPVPSAAEGGPAEVILRLQATAGNAAVAHAIGRGAQRLPWDDEPGAGVPDEADSGAPTGDLDAGAEGAAGDAGAGVEAAGDAGAGVAAGDAGTGVAAGDAGAGVEAEALASSSSSGPGGSSESSGKGGAGGGGGGGGGSGAEKVEVGSTHIGGILSGAPIWHLFVIHTDASGNQTGYRGGPGGGAPKSGFGTIRTTTGKYASGFVDYPAVDTVTVATGPAAAGKDAVFAAELPRIDATATPYAPTGPNSNTVASTLLHKAGLPHNKPVTIAPGFDDPDL